MKRRLILTGALLISMLLSLAACTSVSEQAQRQRAAASANQQTAQSRQANVAASRPADAHTTSDAHATRDSHGHSHDAERVPAFQTDAASLKTLPATLAPEMFTGKQRQAYAVVKEIPQTIAQLPCYCYCDEGFGHKSLYSCFVDDHAAHCAVCMDEALAAYDWQKQERLAPEQIRQRVIEQFSRY